MKIRLPASVKMVLDSLMAKGYEAYAVGGSTPFRSNAHLAHDNRDVGHEHGGSIVVVTTVAGATIGDMQGHFKEIHGFSSFSHDA